MQIVTRKFDTHTIRFIHGDSMEWLDYCPNYDWGICDPPYGLGADNPSKKTAGVRQINGTSINTKIHDYGTKDWDKPPPPEYFDKLIGKTDNQIIWGCNYYDRVFGPGRIVWDKMNNSSNQFDCEIAYCSNNRRTDIVYFMWSGMLQGLHASNKIKISNVQNGNKKTNEKRIHPTQKPVKLYEWTLNEHVKQGETVLDTHGGSGSLAVACHNLKISLDIVENDVDYHQSEIEKFDNLPNHKRIKKNGEIEIQCQKTIFDEGA